MRFRFSALSLALAACSASQNKPDAGATAAQPARFLYAWAGDKDGDATDFLAVYDVRRGSATYGRLLSTVPVNERHTHPHHMQYELPPAGELLYISGYRAERIFLVDFSVAEKPSIVRTLSPAAGFRFPHDLTRMPNGNVLASYLGTDNAKPHDGGLVEYSPRGDLLRAVRSADSAAHGQVRTYALAILRHGSACLNERSDAPGLDSRRRADLEAVHAPAPQNHSPSRWSGRAPQTVTIRAARYGRWKHDPDQYIRLRLLRGNWS